MLYEQILWDKKTFGRIKKEFRKEIFELVAERIIAYKIYGVKFKLEFGTHVK